MSYIKEVEVLDDEDHYNRHLEYAKFWSNAFFRQLEFWKKYQEDEDRERMIKDAERAAHHAREAMKYKAVM